MNEMWIERSQRTWYNLHLHSFIRLCEVVVSLGLRLRWWDLNLDKIARVGLWKISACYKPKPGLSNSLSLQIHFIAGHCSIVVASQPASQPSERGTNLIACLRVFAITDLINFDDRDRAWEGVVVSKLHFISFLQVSIGGGGFFEKEELFHFSA